MFNVKSHLKIQSFKDIQIRKSLQLMFENSWQSKISLILNSSLIVEKMYGKLVHYNQPSSSFGRIPAFKGGEFLLWRIVSLSKIKKPH